MDKIQVEDLRTKLEDDYRRKREAIDLVLGMLSESNGVSLPNSDKSEGMFSNEEEDEKGGRSSPRFAKGELMAKVRKILGDRGAGSNLTVVDLYKIIAAKGEPVPKGSLKVVMQKLVTQGDLQIFIQGSGRRPTLYKVTRVISEQ